MIKRIAGKIIAIMLSVCMMVSVMPAGTVHAEKTDADRDGEMKLPEDLKKEINIPLAKKQWINGVLVELSTEPLSAAEVARVQQVNPLTGNTETVSIFALGKQGTDGIFYTAEINMFQPGQGNILTGIHADTVNTRGMTALTINNGASVGNFTTDNKNLIINSELPDGTTVKKEDAKVEIVSPFSNWESGAIDNNKKSKEDLESSVKLVSEQLYSFVDNPQNFNRNEFERLISQLRGKAEERRADGYNDFREHAMMSLYTEKLAASILYFYDNKTVLDKSQQEELRKVIDEWQEGMNVVTQQEKMSEWIKWAQSLNAIMEEEQAKEAAEKQKDQSNTSNPGGYGGDVVQGSDVVDA